ncbi:hypothetical protein MD537_20215, partial [Flavihumibacter sediminis]|nr:hypothetical protein [Flavihumibacter sediminis]
MPQETYTRKITASVIRVAVRNPDKDWKYRLPKSKIFAITAKGGSSSTAIHLSLLEYFRKAILF